MDFTKYFAFPGWWWELWRWERWGRWSGETRAYHCNGCSSWWSKQDQGASISGPFIDELRLLWITAQHCWVLATKLFWFFDITGVILRQSFNVWSSHFVVCEHFNWMVFQWHQSMLLNPTCSRNAVYRLSILQHLIAHDEDVLNAQYATSVWRN